MVAQLLVVDATGSEVPGPSELGGKAAHLVALRRAGLSVPHWICVPASATTALVAAAAAGDDPDAPPAVRSACIAARLRELGLPAPLQAALESAVPHAFPGETHLAVRSSMVGEDSAKDSFAGQMDTFLHVPLAGVADAVLRCIASAFSERAIVYRRQRGHAGVPRAAVIVQRMVPSRAAGVAFTVNPTTHDASQIVIAAGLGLGEGVVGDLVESDTLFVDRETCAVVNRTIEPKRQRIVYDRSRGAGSCAEDVPPDEGEEPAIDDATATSLARLALRAEAFFGCPQDVEWAVDAAGTLVLLQARPITTLDPAHETVLDNANIVESFPGLSSPLTFTHARALYAHVFRAGLSLLGVPEPALAGASGTLSDLVALVDGRIYYNIGNWYRLFELVPGLERALPAWEKALGLKKRFVPARPDPTLADRFGAAPAQLLFATGLVRRFAELDGLVERCLDAFGRTIDEQRALDLDAIDPHDLLERVEAAYAVLGERYGVAIVNDFYAQQLYALTTRLLEKWLPGDAALLQHALFAGEAGMDSVAPVESALALAAAIRADAGLCSRFEAQTDDRAAFALLEVHPTVGAVARAHVAAYAERVLEELKLETPSLEDDPRFLVQTLRNFLRGDVSPASLAEREGHLRQEAEATLGARLRRRPDRLLPLRLLLSATRRSVRYRENLRLARARAQGLFRRLFRAIGRHFVRAGLMTGAADIVWLTRTEIADVVRGAAVTRDLDALVALRRRDYEAYATRTPASRITTRGIVYARPFDPAPAASALASGELRGIGCSPGRVQGVVKVVLDPHADLDVRGQVLVARTTDPGWVFLMVAAAGLVVEKGSLLSHTAIIGRELGIPTVVGVKDATRRIPTGARVEIDGTAGVIRILGPALCAGPIQ